MYQQQHRTKKVSSVHFQVIKDRAAKASLTWLRTKIYKIYKVYKIYIKIENYNIQERTDAL